MPFVVIVVIVVIVVRWHGPVWLTEFSLYGKMVVEEAEDAQVATATAGMI